MRAPPRPMPPLVGRMPGPAVVEPVAAAAPWSPPVLPQAATAALTRPPPPLRARGFCTRAVIAAAGPAALLALRICGCTRQDSSGGCSRSSARGVGQATRPPKALGVGAPVCAGAGPSPTLPPGPQGSNANRRTAGEKHGAASGLTGCPGVGLSCMHEIGDTRSRNSSGGRLKPRKGGLPATVPSGRPSESGLRIMEARCTRSSKVRCMRPGEPRSGVMGALGTSDAFWTSSGVGMRQNWRSLSAVSPGLMSMLQSPGALSHGIPMPSRSMDLGVILAECDRSEIERRFEQVPCPQRSPKRAGLKLEVAPEDMSFGER